MTSTMLRGLQSMGKLITRPSTLSSKILPYVSKTSVYHLISRPVTSSRLIHQSRVSLNVTESYQQKLTELQYLGASQKNDTWRPHLRIKSKSGLLRRLKSVFLPGVHESELMLKVYNDITENADLFQIWSHCGMPDRFTSWIYMVYMHVWLYIIALEQYEGTKRCRNFLIKHMWADIEDRRRLLKTATFWRKSDLQNLNLVFRNFIMHMDIGYLQTDVELGAAVYKWILNNHHKGLDGKLEEGVQLKNTHVSSTPDVTLEGVELLVKYIRFHAKYLTELLPEDLLLERSLINEHFDPEIDKETVGWKPLRFFLNQRD